MAILKFVDQKGKQVGKMEVSNQTDASADLFFYGDIASESWMSEDYEEDKCPKDVRDFLDGIGDVETLNIRINSGGGSVFGGIAIYNMLMQKKCRKEVWIDGIAASIASVIACAGDVIHLPANATFMVHKPSNGYFFTCMNADDLRKDADILDNCQRAILATYMTRAKDGVSEEDINRLINEETWLVGKEAGEYFDFDIAEESNAVACQSGYFDKYHNTPEGFLPREKGQQEPVDASRLVDAIMERLDARDAEKERRRKEQLEARKQELLGDLDDFGKRDTSKSR